MRFERPVRPLLAALEAKGIAAGLDLSESHPELGPALLVCATETKLEEDIRAYASALEEILKETQR
jgi:glycine dehydrogenase subunit 1